MAATQDVLNLITAIDVATTAIAARIQALIDQLSAGMSPADVATVEAGLQAEVTRLQALGTDPNNPVPPVPAV
jgi:hypothetical protein